MKPHRMSVATADFCRRTYTPLARLALFVIYFWFGLLKVLDLSPATPLVRELFERTVSFMSFPSFLLVFGLFEMLIGVLFLVRGFEKPAALLFSLHMIFTFLPLFIIPAATWSGFLSPTLEGQYIIKNLALIAVVVSLFLNRPEKAFLKT